MQSIAWAPDGTTLATAGDDGLIQVWETSTWRHLHQLTASGPVHSIAYTPDDSTALATAGDDGKFRIWDVGTGRQRRLEGRASAIWSVASADGRTFASPHRVDGVVGIWDAVPGKDAVTIKPKQKLRGHTGAVWSVAYAPGGATLATAGCDGTGRIWDTITGEGTRVLEAHTGPVNSIAYAPGSMIWIAARRCVPGAGADLAAITDAGAVRLFADRAAAVKPGFAVTAGNAAAVAAVVRRLDGIALAVELAAARVPSMTAAELARRLERSFAVLGTGRRGAAERHHTLRAAIDWSVDLLAGAEQTLLARLAVFAGGCTLQAVEGVCGGDGIDPDAVFELLAVLVAQSLVVAEEKGLQTRYRLLETILQYGEERLQAAGQAELWRARHAGYYADLI